jgi:RNA polymerase sigma-70 factor (ECF subfamily)
MAFILSCVPSPRRGIPSERGSRGGADWRETGKEQPLALSDTTARNYELRDPDVRLMLQVRDDNAAAFEELVLRYQGRLMTVLEQLVQKRDLAEDLTQEVFLRVFRARKTYQPGAKFSTWLFTIANNAASNALRSLARRREVNVSPRSDRDVAPDPLDQMALEASSLMPARQLDQSERAQIVRRAIQALSERQRLALLLSKFEGMSYAEIGETMGLSPQAVKSLLSRARTNLRVALEPYMNEGVLPGSTQDEEES